MSDQQDRQHDLPELQQQRRALLRRQLLLLLQITALVVQVACNGVINDLAPLYLHTPYHTSALSGAEWVHELLNGHPQRIRNELGVSRGTFTLLVKSMQALDVNSSRHVSIEEQLTIFLYTVVTGLSCTHVGERFQRSTSTITK